MINDIYEITQETLNEAKLQISKDVAATELEILSVPLENIDQLAIVKELTTFSMSALEKISKCIDLRMRELHWNR